MEETQELAFPLRQSQITAAREFWSGWDSSEFKALKDAFPNFRDAVSIKAIVLNVLYGTNIIAIVKVAACVEQVLRRTDSRGFNLVEELVSEMRAVTHRTNYSFASKYVHFFVDSTVPLLDSYAEWMLGKHLGKMQSKKQNRYEKFIEDIGTLKRVAGLSCDCADLDSYLWVAGEYWWWLEHRHTEVSSDLLPYFQSFLENPDAVPLLAGLLGPDRDPAAMRNRAHARLQASGMSLPAEGRK